MAGNWATLTIGSNVVVNTPGILIANGRPLVFLERSADDRQLLVTADVYAEDGTHVAKLRRNAWAFNDGQRLAITTNPEALTLTERDSGTVLLEAEVVNEDEIVIRQLRLYTPGGDLVQATPDALTFGGITFKNVTVSGFHEFIQITGGGVSVGTGGFFPPDDWPLA